MLWLKIIGGVIGVIVLLVIIVVVAFQNAVSQFQRPALTSCAEGMSASCDGVYESAGLDLSYRLLRPANGAAPGALFVMLHGAGLNGPAQDWLSDGGLQALADRENLLILLPSAGGKHNAWLDGENPNHPDIGEVPDQAPALFGLIERLIEDNAINRESVVVAGYSNGGTMAMRLACETPVPFRAVATFGSPTSRQQLAQGCAQPTPIMVVHGTADSTNRFEGGHPKLFGWFEVRDKNVEPVLSSPETVEFWRTVNGCEAEFTPYDVPEDNPKDGVETRGLLYGGNQDCMPVVHVIIDKGGHFVPGDRALPFAIGLMSGGKRITGYSGYDLLWSFAEAQGRD